LFTTRIFDVVKVFSFLVLKFTCQVMMADEIPVDEEEVISSTPNVTTQPHRRHSHLYSTELTTDQCPIVYAPEYNISFCGVEKCHPFDAKKWGRIFRMLTGQQMIDRA
jgi:hypothetical protein